ncbi:MFS transporter [Streptomyces sp. SBT349]|uniref:MFS transporter n=1 Tax=Streptomyces sp. SBT349 TaxID=1580539 RepID=UPI00066C493F|nr:MFS transporter [Streptomyces sp. SBT349]
MPRRYTPVLRTPGVVIPLATVLTGAAAIGMLDLALLLLTRHRTGSLAFAGAVTGAFGLGNAAGLPLQGRLMDRFGLGPVPAAAGVVCGGALLALSLGDRDWQLIPLALLAGLALPATTAGTRVLLRDLITDPALRPAAYALLGVLFQLGLLAGPLLVSLLLVTVSPGSAVLVAGALAACSGLLFPRAAAGGPHPRRVRPEGGALAFPGVRTLLGGSLLGGLAAGLVGFGVPAVALDHGAPALSGVLLGVAAVGTLVAGLALGTRPRHLPTVQAAATVTGLLLAASTGSLPAFAAVLFLHGACAAPVILAVSTLLDSVAPRAALTQAYALTVCAHLVGTAAGYALGGSLPPAPLPYAAAALAAAVAWTLLRRGTLVPR